MTQITKKDRPYERLVLDFANAETIERAMVGLIENIREVFSFSAEFVENQCSQLLVPSDESLSPYLEKYLSDTPKALTTEEYEKELISLMLAYEDEKSRRVHNWVGMELVRNNVKSLLLETMKNGVQHESKALSFFVSGYNLLQKGDIYVDEEGQYQEFQTFRESDFNAAVLTESFKDVLDFCVVELTKKKELLRLLYKCVECEKYFISKIKREKSKNIFCGEKCKNALHNRKNIKSGYAKEKKREGYRKGRYQ
jgi:hypothetical protein